MVHDVESKEILFFFIIFLSEAKSKNGVLPQKLITYHLF
jgi:hypothetical protein